MSIRNNLRDLQGKIRDQGWRIKWIPWQEQDCAEYVYNTPLTIFTGFGGAAMFMGAALWLCFRQAQWHVLVIGLAGLLMIFLGRLYAAFKKQANWLCLASRCIDQEIKERHFPHKGNVKTVWEYRLLCTFSYNGSEFKVTPEASHVAGFQSQDLLGKYLNERIQPDGTCKLWVDPENPLHAVFDKKQRL